MLLLLLLRQPQEEARVETLASLPVRHSRQRAVWDRAPAAPPPTRGTRRRPARGGGAAGMTVLKCAKSEGGTRAILSEGSGHQGLGMGLWFFGVRLRGEGAPPPTLSAGRLGATRLCVGLPLKIFDETLSSSSTFMGDVQARPPRRAILRLAPPDREFTVPLTCKSCQ